MITQNRSNYMRIYIKGGSKPKRDLAHAICDMFRKQFDKLHPSVKINISINRSTECDGSLQISGNNRFVLIVSNTLDITRFIEVMIHELTHARQYYTNNCTTDCAGVTIWSGKKYDKHYINPKRSEYWIAPWEIEAFGMQSIVLQMLEFKHEISISHLTWRNCKHLISEIKKIKLP